MSGLTSAAVPPLGPDDNVRGKGAEAILYLDLACPHCAAAWARVRTLPLRLCVRHFPVAAKRPRAPALHAATEAAGAQRPDAFWGLWDSIYADHGHLDDPHLWDRARLLGLDLERFDADRRSAAVAERVRADFESGIRAGVTATPTAFLGGERIADDVAVRLARKSEIAGDARDPVMRARDSGSPRDPSNIARVREREVLGPWPPSGRPKGKANT